MLVQVAHISGGFIIKPARAMSRAGNRTWAASAGKPSSGVVWSWG